MKQLNILGILTLTVKNSLKKKIFSRKKPKRLQKFCLVYRGVFGHFTIPGYFRRFPNGIDDSRRRSNISED